MFLLVLLGTFDLFHGKNVFQEAADSISLGHRINTHEADLNPDCSVVPSVVRPAV